MRNFVAKFGKILEICKKFAENQVNERGNVTRCGVVPTFSDLEVVALSITAEAFSIDCENYLFKRLNSECPGAIPNLITRRQYNQRRKKTMLLGESIRQAIAKAINGGEDVFSIDSKPVKVCQNARANRCQMGNDIEHAPAWGYCASQNIFETANITLVVPYRLNQKNWTPPTWAYKRFRKRIETVFSQLNDHLMMIRRSAEGRLQARTMQRSLLASSQEWLPR